MKTAKDIMYETFRVSNKIDMMKSQFIGLEDQGKIIEAMTDYAAQQVAAERERIKKGAIKMIQVWKEQTNVSNDYGRGKVSAYTEVTQLIDSL